MIYDSGSVPRTAIFSPRETSPSVSSRNAAFPPNVAGSRYKHPEAGLAWQVSHSFTLSPSHAPTLSRSLSHSLTLSLHQVRESMFENPYHNFYHVFDVTQACPISPHSAVAALCLPKGE